MIETEKITKIVDYQFNGLYKMSDEAYQDSLKMIAHQIQAEVDAFFEGGVREEIEKAKAQIAELSKKLDDREADLLLTRKQTAEEIFSYKCEECSTPGFVHLVVPVKVVALFIEGKERE